MSDLIIINIADVSGAFPNPGRRALSYRTEGRLHGTQSVHRVIKEKEEEKRKTGLSFKFMGNCRHHPQPFL